jgi:hypothetical protein
MNEVVHKAAASITNKKELLAITNVEFPEAGVQIPCGTIKGGEDLGSAVLREAFKKPAWQVYRLSASLAPKSMTCVRLMEAAGPSIANIFI